MLLRLQNVAEMFAMRYLLETGQAEGEFLQEAEPPWWVWFRLGGQSTSDASAFALFNQRGLTSLAGQVAEPPPSPPDLQSVDWIRILRTFIIKPAQDNRLAEEVILVTGEQAVFFEVVRQHFLIQQGQIEFACFQMDPPLWVARIRQPSRWVLEQLPLDGSWRTYNQVPGSPGIFVQEGWNLSDPGNGLRINQLKLPENTHLLVQSDGGLLSVRPRWQHASTLVEIKVPTPETTQIAENGHLTIVPRLRETDSPLPHELWLVQESQRLQAILANESTLHFAGFSAWFTRQGQIWILATGQQADKGLCSILSDAFPAYHRLEGRVFLPAGRALLPRLPESRLYDIFKCPQGDFLVIEGEGSTLRATMLPGDKSKRLDDFLTFQAEIVFSRIEPFASTWTFDFPGVKKNE